MPQTLAEIQRYTKLFWINTGPYNNLTARKFVLKCTPEAFAAAAATAQKNGAKFPLKAGESLDAMLDAPAAAVLRPRASIRSSPTRRPGQGKDILAASANNLYVGVTMKDLDGLRREVPAELAAGEAGRQARRRGVPRRRQATTRRSRTIVGHLEAAVPYATEPMAKALARSIKFYRTGETRDRVAYDIAWVEDKDSPVDTINGFIEVYMDARGMKGSWEALVFYVNPEKTAEIRKLAADAQWFEDRMPWDAEVPQAGRHRHHRQRHRRRRRDRRLRADHAGRHQPAERSDDSREVRQQVGVALERQRGLRPIDVRRVPARVRVDAGRGGARREVEQRRRRADDQHARGDRPRVGQDLGEAEGQPADGAQGAVLGARGVARRSRGALLPARIRSWPSSGWSTRRISNEIVQAEYEGYTRNALVQLRRVREGTQIEEDHMRNRQMIVRWLMANSKAIDVRERDGKTFFVMIDAKAFQEGVGRLLAEVQRIKAEGRLRGGGQAVRDLRRPLRRRGCATRSWRASIA